MALNPDTKCTIVICHSETIKSTLFEILERMECKICEISSLDDLLVFLQDSNFSYVDFTEVSDNDSVLFHKGNLILKSQEKDSSAPHISEDVHSDGDAGHSKDLVYKSKHMTLGEIENIYIIKILNSCGWKCKTAAKLLGIDRTTLYRKMKKYGIKREE